MVESMDVPVAKGGFIFDLCSRNDMLEKKALKVPGFRKTGTSIVDLVFAREEGIQLVSEAICAGIFNDLGSGSNVDGKTEYLRNHQLPNPRTYVSSN
ncbi:hypothetical protein E2562_000649 [Oryza meyeriana var. granulata]|uniref:Uncharacterized protein n=1 Tax=Oryza meyeriana var. granulata TaxID=110450 RepID=A0A6G1DU67_9ORYZ|nr:hypothetical protein E2562_000649 [Oryza meyeriana var. granulata]